MLRWVGAGGKMGMMKIVRSECAWLSPCWHWSLRVRYLGFQSEAWLCEGRRKIMIIIEKVEASSRFCHGNEASRRKSRTYSESRWKWMEGERGAEEHKRDGFWRCLEFSGVVRSIDWEWECTV